MPAELGRVGLVLGAVYEVVFCDPPPPRRRWSGSDYVAPDSHRPHGTRAKYVMERCRCGPCRRANTAYARERDRAARRPDGGTPAYVPAGRVREHLEWLRDGGVGLRRVAEVSGVSRSALTDIAAGRQRRLRPATGERIMAVSRRDAAAGALVDGSGTWELLERLLAAGCSRTWIARQLGSQAATPALAAAAGPSAALHRCGRRGARPAPGPRRQLRGGSPAGIVNGAAAAKWVDALDEFTAALSAVPRPGTWARRGACRDVPTWVFFPARGLPRRGQGRVCSLRRPPPVRRLCHGGAGAQRPLGRVDRARAPGAASRSRCWAARSEETSLPGPGGHSADQTDRGGALARAVGRVARYPSPETASSMASLLRTGRHRTPPGRWQFEARTDEQGGSELYAQLVAQERVA